jgi:hypothetical protein
MVESFVTQNMVARGETAIGDYLETGQSDYSNIWKEAFADLLLDLDAMDLDTRQLCERLSLQTSVTKTAAFNGTISSEDYAHRMRLVIPVSAITGNAVFTLQGSDDSGSTWAAIQMVADGGTSATTHTISAAATGDSANSYSITRLYKMYRLQLISIGTTVTYTGYMIEEVYTALHRDKTRANIYRSLKMAEGDIWEDKWASYELMYNKRLAEGRLRVDYTDDNAISEREGDRVISNIRFGV